MKNAVTTGQIQQTYHQQKVATLAARSTSSTIVKKFNVKSDKCFHANITAVAVSSTHKVILYKSAS